MLSNSTAQVGQDGIRVEWLSNYRTAISLLIPKKLLILFGWLGLLVGVGVLFGLLDNAFQKPPPLTKAHEAININSLPGRFYFIAEDVTKSPVSGQGTIKHIYTMRANGADIQKLAPEYSNVRHLIWYPQLKQLGFDSNCPVRLSAEQI